MHVRGGVVHFGHVLLSADTWGVTGELPTAYIPSNARVLNGAGYESFLCGKQHYHYARRYRFTEVGGDFNSGPAA